MILVLEGCDGSGKTTLARHLTKSLRGVYLNTQIVPPANPDFFNQLSVAKYIESNYCPRVIVDRFHAISDLIYAPIIRNSPAPIDIFAARALLRDLKIIHCDPGAVEVINNIEATQTDQMASVRDRAIEIHSAYRDFFIRNPPWRIWNYLHHDYNEFLTLIKEIQ